MLLFFSFPHEEMHRELVVKLQQCQGKTKPVIDIGGLSKSRSWG